MSKLFRLCTGAAAFAMALATLTPSIADTASRPPGDPKWDVTLSTPDFWSTGGFSEKYHAFVGCVTKASSVHRQVAFGYVHDVAGQRTFQQVALGQNGGCVSFGFTGRIADLAAILPDFGVGDSAEIQIWQMD